MPNTVELEIDGHKVVCSWGQRLLDVMYSHGYVLPAACSGHGQCHQCWVWIWEMSNSAGTMQPQKTRQLACQVVLTKSMHVQRPAWLAHGKTKHRG